MRTGVAVSGFAHLAIIAWGLFTITATPSDTEIVETLPVELITVAELTDLARGDPTKDPVETPAPTPTPAETPPPPPPPAPEPPPPPEPPAPEPPPPAPAPAPPPEPVPAPAPPEPAPPPLPAERPEPAPAPPPAPSPAPPQEVAAAPPATPPPIPRPRPRYTPPVVQPTPQPQAQPTPPAPPTPAQSQFDALAIQALIDQNAAAPPGQAVPQQTPGLGIANGNLDAAMTQDEIAAFRERIMQCWEMPPGATLAADVRTEVFIRMNPDGSLAGEPEIMRRPLGRYATVAPEGVARAILRCSPYNLPSAKYDQWREIILDFNPIEMFGG